MKTEPALVLSNDMYRGIKGSLAALVMNAMHKRIHREFCGIIGVRQKEVLDIGCGGGGLIRQMLSGSPEKVCGFDLSRDMVRIARRVNKAAVSSKKAQIDVASVSDIPYAQNSFDIATAFETIQYWPDITGGIKEVLRVLKPGGVLCVMNRLSEKSSKWYDRIPLKEPRDYREALECAGLHTVVVDTGFRKGWIFIRASK